MNKFSFLLGGCTLVVTGCDQHASPRGEIAETQVSVEVYNFVNEVMGDMAFVKGGEFLMGDFGSQYAPEGLPYDKEKHSKPLHKVELSDFSIDRFKITNERYQFFLRSNGLKLREVSPFFKAKWDAINSLPNTPAHLDWYEAERYCSWLSLLTGKPFSLPTEAQWEYAARSRGQFLMVATDDGTYRAEPGSKRTEFYEPKGINIGSAGNRIEFSESMGWAIDSFSPLPVDMFPPNPLGLYSMSDNGLEWVKDWYDPDYYARSPVNNPQGPEAPIFKNYYGYHTKVMRGNSLANPYWGGGTNVYRKPHDPLGRMGEKGRPFLDDKTARCVVNHHDSLK